MNYTAGCVLSGSILAVTPAVSASSAGFAIHLGRRLSTMILTGFVVLSRALSSMALGLPPVVQEQMIWAASGARFRSRRLFSLRACKRRARSDHGGAATVLARAGGKPCVSDSSVMARADYGVLFRLDLPGSRLRLDRLGHNASRRTFFPCAHAHSPRGNKGLRTVSSAPLRSVPDAAPIASGLSIAIEAAAVAGS